MNRPVLVILCKAPNQLHRHERFFSIAETAMLWSSNRHAGNYFRMASEDLVRYITNYRQREDGTLKATFWKRYLQAESLYLEMIGMPRKTGTPVRDTTGSLTFLNLRLTEEQLADADEQHWKPTQILAAMEKALMTGLALSFSYNAERKTANAFFADRRPGLPTSNYALGAFSDDCGDALRLLLYKHFVVLSEDWTELLGVEPARRSRG